MVTTFLPTHELHTHLYGAVSAETLWELARDTERNSDKITWYKSEFFKAYGRPSRIDDFWRRSDGLALLRNEYCYTEPGAFAKFQASINLPIALFPLRPSAHPLFPAAVSDHVREGVSYAEYRVFLAPYFSESERQSYITAMAEQAAQLERHYGGTMQPRLVFSLVRLEDMSHLLYMSLRNWQRANPALAHVVVGIDFCGSEDGFPPKRKVDFMARLHADNEQNPELGLAMLYHVGETFEHLLPESAARWVHEAHELGCHRLGHAVALGISPLALKGRTFSESLDERSDHLRWLARNKDWLTRYGYEFREKPLKDIDKRVSRFYDEDALDEFTSLQNAILKKLSDDDAIIETCPTSNKLISHIAGQHLPALRFLMEKNLKVVIGADDPGIFSCTLADDVALCHQLGAEEFRLKAALNLASQSTSKNLINTAVDR